MKKIFSHSQLDTYSKCPKQYKFKYIDRVEVEKMVSVEIVTGQILHSCLEKIYEVADVRRALSLEEVMIRYDAAWAAIAQKSLKVSDASLGVQDYIERGREALTKFHNQYYPFDDGVTLDVELRVTATLDPEGEYKVQGQVDRLRRRPDGVVEIVDYKFKKGIPRQDELDRDPQMGLYHLAVKQNWPNFDKIEVRQIYLRQNEEFHTAFSEELLEDFRHEIIQQMREVRRAALHDDFPTRESALCRWCPYVPVCPAFRHRNELSGDEVSESALSGRELADRFLTLKRQVKNDEAELEALKADIVRLSREQQWSTLEGEQGKLRITDREVEKFPTKKVDEDSVLEISEIIRQAHHENPALMLDSYFDVNLRSLYKDGYAKQALPEDLLQKLAQYVIKRREPVVRTSYAVGEDDTTPATNTED